MHSPHYTTTAHTLSRHTLSDKHGSNTYLSPPSSHEQVRGRGVSQWVPTGTVHSSVRFILCVLRSRK